MTKDESVRFSGKEVQRHLEKEKMKNLESKVKLYRYVRHFRAVEIKFLCREFSYKITGAHLEECDDKGGVRKCTYKNDIY
jgi:hypothetical protein